MIAAYAREALAPFEFDEMRLVPPTRIFSGELELEVGGRELRLIEVGPAHTPGDLIVWGSGRERGDRGRHPLHRRHPDHVGGAARGLGGGTRAPARARRRAVRPGHGPVCGREEVRQLIDYWRWLDQAARQRLTSGMSPPETARELVLGDEIAERGFADWLAPERALVSVGTIDAHRRGAAKLPGPRELIAAFFAWPCWRETWKRRVAATDAGKCSRSKRRKHERVERRGLAEPSLAGARTTPPRCVGG